MYAVPARHACSPGNPRRAPPIERNWTLRACRDTSTHAFDPTGCGPEATRASTGFGGHRAKTARNGVDEVSTDPRPAVAKQAATDAATRSSRRAQVVDA